jgi:hypothetical protein
MLRGLKELSFLKRSELQAKNFVNKMSGTMQEHFTLDAWVFSNVFQKQ